MKKKWKIEKSQISIALVYVVVFAITILLSVWNVGLDLTQLGKESFWGDLCLNYALVIVILFASVNDGEKWELSKEYYLMASAALRQALETIQKRKLQTVFRYYVKNRYEKSVEKYIDDTLFKIGLSRDYLNLSLKEIKMLKEKKEIDADQYLELKRLKIGDYDIEKVSTEEILSEFKSKEPTQYSLKEHSKQIKIREFGPKMIMLFAVSAILSSYIIQNYESNVANVLVGLAMRLMSIVSAIFCGYMSAPKFIEEKARVKTEKAKYINEFIVDFDSGVYHPKEEEMSQSVIEKILELSHSDLDPSAEEEEDKKEEEIELTKEELDLILKNREKASTGSE